MIFGKTDSQKLAERNAKILRKAKGVSKYAWYPVKVDNGQWIWLEFYYAYYHVIDNYYAGKSHYSLVDVISPFAGYKKTCSLNATIDYQKFITTYEG